MTQLLMFLTLAANATEKEEEEDLKVKGVEFAPAATRMLMEFADLSVTPGGAQDIGYFRDRIAAGEIPHPAVFTPEGLLGEHDLPIDGKGHCNTLLCPIGEATEVALIAQPEARYLAQLGFDSGIDAATWAREPVNLVAVVDKSGSMGGQPIGSVQEALRAVLGNLRPGDRLSIVLYGDTVHTLLGPTPSNDRTAIARAIDGITISGSTNMEAGLVHGFDLARSSARGFEGITRVMLFTDERPNTGRTDAGSFMDLAIAGSRDGIGMTTIGVGQQFGAELATQISSVRGGNLFFFPDANKMRQTFATELDTMITELAYDMDLTVAPAEGMKIVGVYGIPGDAVTWGKDGALEMNVATLFASHEEGAIYFAFAPVGDLPQRHVASVGRVDLSFTLRSGERPQRSVDFAVTRAPQMGLQRGSMLVDEVTVFKAATTLHHEKNDQEGAWRLVHELAGRWAGVSDPDLQNEIDLIGKLENKLALLSGHQGEAPALTLHRNSVTGLPGFRHE